MSITRIPASELKNGSYVMIEDEPCVVIRLAKSKPGKHGHAKIRVEAKGVFDESRRSKIFRAQESVEVPLIDKRTAQVVSVSPDSIQIMDSQTYEVLEMPLSSDEKIRERLEPGTEVEYWSSFGIQKLMKVLGR